MNSHEIVIVSDLDGTLTTVESSWEFLLKDLKLWEGKGEKNLERFLTAEIDYDEFIRLDVNLLKGIHKKRYFDCLSKIPLRNSLQELFSYLYNQFNNLKIIIISSGLKDLAVRVAKIVPITYIFANEIHYTNEYLNGNYTKNVGWHDKEKIMNQLRKDYSSSFFISFGDTLADLPLITLSDLSFSCFSKSKELKSNATYSINDLHDAIHLIDNYINDKQWK